MRMRSIISLMAFMPIKKGISIFFIILLRQKIGGLDWSGIVDGTRSKYIWETFVEFDEIPQILNPHQDGLQVPIRIHLRLQIQKIT